MYTLYIEPILNWVVVIFILCSSYKFICRCFESCVSYLKRKIDAKRKQSELKLEKQKRQREHMEWEDETLYTLMNLTKKEITRIRYLLKQPSYIAYFPSDDLSIFTLSKKGCIAQVKGFYKNIEQVISIHQSDTGIAFYIPKDILYVINKHYSELMPLWRKVPINTLFDLFQE